MTLPGWFCLSPSGHKPVTPPSHYTSVPHSPRYAALPEHLARGRSILGRAPLSLAG